MNLSEIVGFVLGKKGNNFKVAVKIQVNANVISQTFDQVPPEKFTRERVQLGSDMLHGGLPWWKEDCWGHCENIMEEVGLDKNELWGKYIKQLKNKNQRG